MFNNPKGYNGLPYKHNYTKSGETVYTGFFIPAFTFVSGPGYIDNRGVTNIAKAKEYYENKRRQLLSNPKNYIIECAEYCFNPEDALALEGDNIFNTEILADQLSQIRIYKNGPKPQAGTLEYSFKNNIHKEENIDKVIFKPKPSGKVLVLEEPILDKDGNVPRNLYVAGIDGIDLGQEDTSDATNDPSKFAVVVMRRQQGLKEPTIVCIYKDRPRTLKEAHMTCLKILQWYNCKAVLEATRVSLLAFFRERHLENRYLFRRPKMTQSDIQRGQSKQFGAPASETVIRHQLELIANYIDEFGQNIWFEDVLEELLKYSYQNKGKFDLVAAMGQMLLGNEELMDIKPQDIESSNNVFPLLGYWKDENGIRHFGVVPDKDELKGNIKVGWNNDYDGPRTSNPRYHIGNL